MGSRGDPKKIKQRKNVKKTVPLKKLWLRVNGKCWLCNKRVEMEDASRDHVKDLALGGTNGWTNVKLAHKKCNHDRSNPPQFWSNT
jgi:5-methylcytosine-specific restriction endonuclease McrA